MKLVDHTRKIFHIVVRPNVVVRPNINRRSTNNYEIKCVQEVYGTLVLERFQPNTSFISFYKKTKNKI